LDEDDADGEGAEEEVLVGEVMGASGPLARLGACCFGSDEEVPVIVCFTLVSAAIDFSVCFGSALD